MHNSNYDFYQSSNYLWCSPKFVRTLLSKSNEDTIKSLAKILSNDIQNQILFSHNEISLDSIIVELERMSLSQGQNFIVNNEDDFLHCTLLHQINSKWGNFFSAAISDLMNTSKIPIRTIKSNSDYVKFSIPVLPEI